MSDMPNFIYMSAVAVPLIAVIAAVRFFTVYRLPKKTFYVLWGIALCCLFIPFNLLPHLNVSGFIENFGGPKEMSVKAPETAEILADPVNTSKPEESTNVSPEAASPSATTVIYNIYDTIDRFGRDMLGRIDMISAAGDNIANTPVKTSILNIPPLLLIWFAGFFICAVYFTVSHIRFRKKYAPSLPVENSFVLNWKNGRFGAAKRKITIRQSDLLVSPLTYGIFKPVILLSKTTDYRDEKKLEYILLHEYTHIKRFDTLAKLFLTAALCVHWFNLFVWLMYILANRDIELSCDETVVKKLSPYKNANTKSDYALTLIALEEKKMLLNASVSYFSKNIMKERIKSIMKLKKTSIARILLAVMLVSMVGTLFITLQSCENNENPKKTDDTPVVMQDATDKLIIYTYSLNERILNAALNIFKEKYPDVEIERRSFDNADFTEAKNEYMEAVKTELAAGKGPDLVLGLPHSDYQDVYKSMEAGVFADLNPFMENDGGFNMDDYVKAVLDSGVYKGKRYVMPIEYRVPVLLTTQETLDAEGITPSDLATFDGFINTLENYIEKYKNNPNKSIFQKYPWVDTFFVNAFPWCGIDPINYSTGKVDVDNPYFKSILEIVKLSYVGRDEAAVIYNNGPNANIQSFQNQEILFDAIAVSSNATMFYDIYSQILEKKLTPVFLKYPGIGNASIAKVNTFAAIPKSSQNQINAYNLLKIILSEDIQAMMYLLNNPVLKSAVRTTGENQVYGYDDIPGLYYPVPEDKFDEYIDLQLDVDSCKLMASAVYNDFLMNDMLPFFEGEKSFEDCAGILKNNLELYISE